MGNKKAKEEKKDPQQAHEEEAFQADSTANFFEGYKIRNLVSVSNHSMVLTDHDAYAWGNNDKGQLGFGDIRNRSIPTKLVLDTGVPLALDCGCYHTIATTKQGLYAWGYAGCLGQGYSKNEMLPVKINELPEIVSLHNGFFHVIVKQKDGNYYSWGNNQYGQLGLNDMDPRTKPERIVFPESNPDYIVCGGYHSIGVCNGEMFSWGFNEFGQLGQGHQKNGWLPKRFGLPGNLPVISVACGKYHSMCIAKETNKETGTVETLLFAWGLNEHGQLGVGDKLVRQSPVEVKLKVGEQMVPFKKPISVSCGEHHSFVLTEGGLYAMGSNRFGQLGLKMPMGRESMVLFPTKMSFYSYHEVTKILCGEQHTFALARNEIYVWGNNDFGQLGLGDNEHRNRPTKITKIQK